MPATQYQLTPGTLASNCYPALPQTLYIEMFAKGFVTIDLTGVIISSTTPVATDRDKLWIKLDGGNNPVRQFVFNGGDWLWPHEIPLNDARRTIYTGTLASIDTLDGGVAGAISSTSGPFWAQDTDFDARFPFGIGTTAGGTVITEGGTGGTDEETLTVAQIPAHTHDGLPRSEVDSTSGGDEHAHFAAGTQLSDSTGGGDPHNNLPPYRGVYFIKRTARIYYVG